MLIFKVMVCFLAVFTSEDYVGGLPTIQDSPDNHQAGQSARSASNQGIANELGSRPREILDYAEERDEEEVQRKVNHEIKMINPVEISSGKIKEEKLFHESSSSATEGEDDHMPKSRTHAQYKNENIRRNARRKGSSGTNRFVDKTKSINEEGRSFELEKEMQRFSSSYAKVDLDEKVNKNKEDFKNDLSAYLTDVLDTVVTGKVSTSSQTTGEKSKNDNLESGKNVETENPSKNNAANDTGDNLLSKKTKVPVPIEESNISSSEYRQRKSVGDIVTWHQQSTNMRPTRTQHLVQNKRSAAEGTLLKLPGHGGRRSTIKNPRTTDSGSADSNRRHFNPHGSSSLRENQLQFSGIIPVQINAAMAYSNRLLQPVAQGLSVDLSRAMYQFGPANIQALKGVFDKVPPPSQNFKPIAPKQVAYVPPRIIYETKILPAPFRTEQKTVDALSALLGQNPKQQLEGFNLILGKGQPSQLKPESSPVVNALPGISRQGFHEVVALNQAFVTPIPSLDINSGLSDNSFTFTQDAKYPSEEIREEVPLNHKTPQYQLPENVHSYENPFKTIPIVEEQEETQPGKEVQHVWQGAEIPEKTKDENNHGRYSQHSEESRNHGDAYASRYSFGYHVKDHESGNDFGHQETRDGVITNGRYHVLLPDGRLQNVKYHVDEGGYHAKVSYQSTH